MGAPMEQNSAKAPSKIDIFTSKERMDAAAARVQRVSDGFKNFAARLGVSPGLGQGTEDNLLSKGHYIFNLLTRNRVQLEAAYRGSWIVGQVIDAYAEDMTREGIQLKTNEGAEDVEEVSLELHRTKTFDGMRENIQWSRLYGGSIGVVQIKGQNLASPLRIESVGKDQYQGLAIYDRWQLYPSLDDLIQEGPDLGLPKYYDIVLGGNLNDPMQAEAGKAGNPNDVGRVRVHHSRCFRMIGIKLPYWQAITEMLWGESVLERMWDRLIAFDDATMSAGNLINRANLRTVQVEGLRQILAAGGPAEEALLSHFEYMRMFQSNEGLTLLDKEDVFASTAYSFAGIPETIIQFGQQVSGAAKIPLVRLFGQSPAGMNATGESDIRLYYDGIKASQEANMRPFLTDLVKIVWQSKTGKKAPSDLTFNFVPLWQMSATDKATVAKTNTDTLIAANESGGIDRATMMKELKASSSETGLFTHITDEMIEEAEQEANDPPPMPGDPASAVAQAGEKSLNESKKTEAPKEDPKMDPSKEESAPKAKDSIWQRFFKKKPADTVNTADKASHTAIAVKAATNTADAVSAVVTDHQKIKVWLSKNA